MSHEDYQACRKLVDLKDYESIFLDPIFQSCFIWIFLMILIIRSIAKSKIG